MINYRFSKTQDAEFSVVLKKRVNEYFKERDLTKNADSQMVFHTVLALSTYILPFVLMLVIGSTNLVFLFSMWILMGVGVALVGTTVMHDSVHGSFSKNKSVNKWMAFSAPILGIDSTVWRLQHNVLHHTYTNIEHADEDIQARYVMRFSPHQPKKWFHKYQYIYALFFYGISTMIWIVAKDYVKLFRYRKQGLIKPGKEFRSIIIGTFIRKMLYLSVILGLPILILDVPWGQILLMYASMHVVMGLLLSFIFQSAHVIETSEFIDQTNPEIEDSWSVHQLKTTSNYAVDSKFVTWFTGGLNFQVEHHLFPNICHVHYPKISKIVKTTAQEFNLPYYAQESFFTAILNHFRMLKKLGEA